MLRPGAGKHRIRRILTGMRTAGKDRKSQAKVRILGGEG